MKLKIPFISDALSGLSRKWLLAIGSLGVAGFLGGSLLASMLLGGGQDPAAQAEETIEEVKQASIYAEDISSLEKLEKLSPTEAQIQDMLRLYREKLAEVEMTKKRLETEQQRLDLQQQDLEKMSGSLQEETTRLEAAAKRIRQAKLDLQKTRINYTQQERIAAGKQATMFEGMQPDQAAANLTSCYEAGNFKQALLILDSMDEKKAGRALAEIKDAKFVALLIEKLPKLRLLQQSGKAGPP